MVWWRQVGVEGYTEWIQLVADLTVSSLASWQWASGSVYYLLGLWSRLVSSMPYLKGDSPSLLDTYVPRINQAYITSRWACLAPCLPPYSHLSSDAVRLGPGLGVTPDAECDGNS